MDSAERRRARASWLIRRVLLAEEGERPITGASPFERVAMVQALTDDAWAMSGAPMPDNPRHQAPRRVIRRGA